MPDSRSRVENMFRTMHRTAPLDRPRQAVEARLDMLTSSGDEASRLGEAMRYALLAPGKRFRPLLTIAAAERHGGSLEGVLDVACAVECIHAASLILDDLPCMDDAEFRRGRQATHVAFGESTALLASVGLLSKAFEIVASAQALDTAARSDVIAVLAGAVSPAGLVGGQFADLTASTEDQCGDGIGERHSRKTGALFAAAVESGARVAGAGIAERALMRSFGLNLGQAYQHLDDVADATGSTETMGKDVGKDANRATLAVLDGIDGGLRAADRHLRAAAVILHHNTAERDPLARLFATTFGWPA